MGVFEQIYRKNAWNGRESRSGPGSEGLAVTKMADELKKVTDALPNVMSVLDVGCGDCNWQPYFPGYLGVDTSKTAIELARSKPRNSGRNFEVLNATVTPLPRADLVISRDVFQHLSLANGMKILNNIRKNAQPKWLILSTYTDNVENIDIIDGWYYRPNMEVGPFNLGEPLKYVFDGYHYDEEEPEERDPWKWLGVWSLP